MFDFELFLDSIFIGLLFWFGMAMLVVPYVVTLFFVMFNG